MPSVMTAAAISAICTPSLDPPQVSLRALRGRATRYHAKCGGKMPVQPIRTLRGWALGRAQPLQWWSGKRPMGRRWLSQEGVAWDTGWDLGRNGDTVGRDKGGERPSWAWWAGHG